MPNPQPAPPRTYYRGRPMSEINDRRLRRLASPRHNIAPDLRVGFRVEMGRRYYLRALASANVQGRDDHQP
jgi:hypothetical protein